MAPGGGCHRRAAGVESAGLQNDPEQPWLALVGGMGDATFAAVRSLQEMLPPGRSEYFSHLDDGRLLRAAMARPPGQKLVLVGHSWGGEMAARVTIRLARAGRPVALLVTVDPVKRVLTQRFLKELRAAAPKWVNILATGGDALERSNVIAAIGGPWGGKPEPLADAFIAAPYAHREFAGLLGFRPAGGRSGWDWVQAASTGAA